MPNLRSFFVANTEDFVEGYFVARMDITVVQLELLAFLKSL